jgi:hypothetical protein
MLNETSDPTIDEVASDFAGALFDTTTFLSTTPSPPSVVTTSYGLDEAQFSPQDLQYVLVLSCGPCFFFFFFFLTRALAGRSAMDTWPPVLAASLLFLPLGTTVSMLRKIRLAAPTIHLLCSFQRHAHTVGTHRGNPRSSPR